MADILIDDECQNQQWNSRGGPFWITPLIGYVIYLGYGLPPLEYRKTLDGGETWEDPVVLNVGTVLTYDCRADWQTAGDAGTKIHIACLERNTNTVMYIYIDTSDDSTGTDTIEACQGSGTFAGNFGFNYSHVSITKTRGGNIAVAARYKDDIFPRFYVFYTSPDGDTWTSRASPWEDSYQTFLQLYPANLADNQDLWAAFWDFAADEISLKTFDDSGNSWAEDVIAGTMAEAANYMNMAGVIRLSDGHLIFVAWNLFDDAAADLMCWDITDGGTITAKTNVLTNSTESFLCSVFIDQSTDFIYVVYARGSAIEAEVKVFYKKSEDGGATWGGETAMQANAEDDERWISAGAVKLDGGGRFEPVWWNADIEDLFTNFDNSFEIAGIDSGITDKSANMAAKMIAGKLI